MLSAFEMAQLCHAQLIDQTRRLQREVVEQNMVDASFGLDALPATGDVSLPLTLHRTQEWRDERRNDKNNKIEKNIKAIERLEKAIDEAFFEPGEVFKEILIAMWREADNAQ